MRGTGTCLRIESVSPVVPGLSFRAAVAERNLRKNPYTPLHVYVQQ